MTKGCTPELYSSVDTESNSTRFPRSLTPLASSRSAQAPPYTSTTPFEHSSHPSLPPPRHGVLIPEPISSASNPFRFCDLSLDDGFPHHPRSPPSESRSVRYVVEVPAERVPLYQSAHSPRSPTSFPTSSPPHLEPLVRCFPPSAPADCPPLPCPPFLASLGSQVTR
ncbi:protein TRACHEARY ELEMENT DIFFERENTIATION-RELATED 7A-like [Ischnura elegans]|uniref:protein TRACHEARY ELEMENT DIFFERENTIATION-RELATED 7A-like n=1 Tax=Ischnura elegans TaxID=197161 RepID=UPI001ED869A8|nr:protein TRACHEARY ELEMENT DIFFERENTIATION-RELATED 7A-like [Ischnura elegans]